ncbi:Thioredoxin domain-containing protein [Sphingomonas antarctica]|uniref:DsbA family protein n=1 Tax=Sphingomonas antarctica TaxID=2040274 RepID=UPI0039E76257
MIAIALLLAAAAPVPAPDRAAIEAIVRDYILEHPEILPEAMNRLQSRETANAITTNRDGIFKPFANAWEGAADADLTIVQFFDYDCGYCRRSLPDIDRLLAEDHKLRIVYREFPVLGPNSEVAAKASLAAARGKSYPAFHRAMYAAKDLSAAEIDKVAAKFGVRLVDDPVFSREIDANRSLARPLSLTGTPSWVIGGQVLSGAVGYDALKTAISAARAKSGAAG